MHSDPPQRPPLPEPPVRRVRGRGLWRWLPGPHDLADHYDRAACSWHTVQRLSGYLRAFHELVVGLLADGTLRPDALVLDCGVGTGALSLGFASAGVQRLWGVDVSSGMLHEARFNLIRAGVAPALCQGDIRQLPYADAAFDLVASAHVLEHLADPGLAISEMARVLRPGGVLLLVYTRETLLDALVRLRWGHVPLDPGQLREWLTTNGFAEPTPLVFGRPGSLPHWLSAALLARRPALER